MEQSIIGYITIYLLYTRKLSALTYRYLFLGTKEDLYADMWLYSPFTTNPSKPMGNWVLLY
jgi:hypothetical protein